MASSNTPNIAIQSNSSSRDPRPHRGQTRARAPICAPHPAHCLTDWTISPPDERGMRTRPHPGYIIGPAKKLPATNPITSHSTSAASTARTVYASAFSSGAFISTGNPRYMRYRL
jgi:hypothetical protein